MRIVKRLGRGTYFLMITPHNNIIILAVLDNNVICLLLGWLRKGINQHFNGTHCWKREKDK